MRFGGDKPSSNHGRSKTLSLSVNGIFHGSHPQHSQGTWQLGQGVSAYGCTCLWCWHGECLPSPELHQVPFSCRGV